MDGTVLLTWRGGIYTVAANEASRLGSVTLFPPRPPHFRTWVADLRLPGTRRFVEAEGGSAQEALDRLAAVLPVDPLAPGGSC